MPLLSEYEKSQLKKRECVAKESCVLNDVHPELPPNNHVLNTMECEKAKEGNQKAPSINLENDYVLPLGINGAKLHPLKTCGNGLSSLSMVKEVCLSHYSRHRASEST